MINNNEVNSCDSVLPKKWANIFHTKVNYEVAELRNLLVTVFESNLEKRSAWIKKKNLKITFIFSAIKS